MGPGQDIGSRYLALERERDEWHRLWQEAHDTSMEALALVKLRDEELADLRRKYDGVRFELEYMSSIASGRTEEVVTLSNELARWRPRLGEELAAFVLEGEPQPWQRPTPGTRRNGFVQTFHGQFAEWRRTAISLMSTWWGRSKSHDPIREPIVVLVEAVYGRPGFAPTYQIDGHQLHYPFAWESWRLPAVVVGDVDNLAKAVLDAAQHGTQLFGPMLAEDRLVVDLRVRKLYAAEGEQPRTEVRIWRAA